jgi:hypothetical protein
VRNTPWPYAARRKLDEPGNYKVAGHLCGIRRQQEQYFVPVSGGVFWYSDRHKKPEGVSGAEPHSLHVPRMHSINTRSSKFPVPRQRLHRRRGLVCSFEATNP